MRAVKVHIHATRNVRIGLSVLLGFTWTYIEFYEPELRPSVSRRFDSDGIKLFEWPDRASNFLMLPRIRIVLDIPQDLSASNKVGQERTISARFLRKHKIKVLILAFLCKPQCFKRPP